MTGRNSKKASPKKTSPIPISDDTGNGAGTRRAQPLAVGAQWKSGARSAAWDELWRRILNEVLQPEEEELPRPSGREVSP